MIQKCKLTTKSADTSCFENLNRMTWVGPETHMILLSVHINIDCMANGSSSLSSEAFLGLSNTLAVLSL